MAIPVDDNQERVIEEAAREFVDARWRGEEPNVDEFVSRFPHLKHELRQRIQDIRQIDTLFDSLVQTDESDFAEAVSEPDLVGQTIGNFEIMEMIGRGGMGIVYLARDTKLKRSVAVKSMPANLAGDSTARMRFRREAELLASLNHPNIAVIYEIIEQDQSGYLILEYVPGETLTQRMAREPLTVEQALSTGEQIARAISAAHKKGIVHRDLKPGNIKITPEGQVKVLDFGLAKPFMGEDKRSEITATQSGRVIGTPAYMSPEQARGESTDQRTDIWSFGCLMYQMLTGQLPFEGRTATDTLARIIEREPDWKSLPEETPADIRTLLRRCLEKDPEKRLGNIIDATVQISDTLSKPVPAQTPAVSPRLRTVMWMVGASIIIVLLAVALRLLPEKQAQPTPKEIRLVVLPFENLGPAEDEWFVDGMTDEITGRLAGIHGLGVISRQSAIQYKNKEKSTPQIAQELDVDYILEGTIQREKPSDPNSRVRIRSQLIRTTDDTHVWTEQYDNNMSKVLNLQSQVAEKVALALDITLLKPERQALLSLPTENAEAYNFYLQGNEYFHRSLDNKDDHEIAIQMYGKAIELDSRFALAYTQLSMAHSYMYWYYERSDARLVLAKDNVDKAFQLNPKLPEAYRALGYYYYWGYLEYDLALEQFAIARKSLPNDSLLLSGIAYVQRRQGKIEEAADTLEKALKLSPRDIGLIDNLGETYLHLRDFTQYERCRDRAISLFPDQPRVYTQKAWVYLIAEGNIQKARTYLQQVIENSKSIEENPFIIRTFAMLDVLDGRYQEALDRLALLPEDVGNEVWSAPAALKYAKIYGYMKKKEMAEKYYNEARIILESKILEQPDDAALHSWLGIAYAGLGQKEDAIRYGELGVEKLPVTKDALRGPFRIEDLALIYVMVGKHDEAIDKLRYLLSIEYQLSVPWLQIDPDWDPLRDHQGFKKLLEGGNSLKEIQPSTKEIRLVVLPFDNLGPSNDEWFADGMTDEITSRLAGIHDLGVISRQSAIQYKKKEKNTPQIAQELDVDYILEGTIQRENPLDPNSRVRIRSQLIRTTDDTHVWTEQYDNNMTEVLSLQSKVAEMVAQALDLTLLEPERKLLASRPTQNTEAFSLYLQSKDIQSDLENRKEIAIEMLNKAIELDPNFTLAYVRLAHLYTGMYWFHEDHSEECLARAEQAARKALELDPELPESYVAMARYFYQGHLDFDNALKHLVFVRKRYPNHEGMLYWTGNIRKRQGKFQLAVDNLEKAFELNPLGYNCAVEIGLNYLLMRKYPESEYYYNKAISLAPHLARLYSTKAWLYLCWNGETGRARRVVEDGLQKSGSTQKPLVNTMLITIDIFEGKYQEALEKLFLKPEDINELDYFIPYDLRCALIYMFMKNTELAKTHFEKARVILEDKIKRQPEDDRYYSALGITYAGLGRKEDAIKMGQRGAEELPFTEDGSRAQSRHEDLARIFTMIGDFDAAIDKLEFLLNMDGDLSVSLLRLDPAWKPLHDYPHFQKLLKSGNE